MSLPQQIQEIERPDPSLMIYYLISSFLGGPAFPIPMLLGYFRFSTLRYRFDDEGISMSWGILHSQEIHLTYARIQDIHLTSNIVERWLGLAKVRIQTASGSSKDEMTVQATARNRGDAYIIRLPCIPVTKLTIPPCARTILSCPASSRTVTVRTPLTV